ncbi:MAG: nitrogenase-stabilizing/protective protein NifW [Betaproteobacteria bacterium]|nr:nitrogenase-stabilizing/protective protein NifW [Betaproteobacteria bacterium]
MDDLTLDEALDDLESAEDFLNYFGIAFDPAVVHVNRLHILQRYHNYLARAGALPQAEAPRREAYAAHLARAYQDFVQSDALTEKVFKVFHMHEPQTAFVPLSAIAVAARPEAAAGGCGCGGKGMCHSSQAALDG